MTYNNIETLEWHDEHLRLEFNEWARAGRGEGMEKGHRPVGEQAIARMNLIADCACVDVGCGSGWATRLMAETCQEGSRGRYRYFRRDDSRWRDRSSTAFPNVEFKVASAEALPFQRWRFYACVFDGIALLLFEHERGSK